MKIAKTVAEAQVGEMLWRWDPDANRYDANRKYEGRGVWALVAVEEVGRVSVVAGPQKYDRKTGAKRPPSNYGSGGPRVRGSDERTTMWWEGQSSALSNEIRFCRNVETLKTVAFALGFDGPPDFTVDPTSPRAQEDRSDG